MIIRCLAVLAFTMTGMAQADDATVGNPLTDAKVGDWVRYKLVNDQLADAITITQRVTKKDKDNVTIEVVTKFGDTEGKAVEQKLSLAEPFEPIKLYEKMTGNKSEVAFEKNGAEEIIVKGKKYDTKWQEFKITTKMADNPIVSPLKIWTSKSVPIMGIVKIQTDFAGVNVRLEVEDFGSEKK